MKVIVGIPARMGSSRFPGKPLANILGIPMLEHVYKRCQLAKNIDDLFVAACDEEIRQTVAGFGGKIYMTPKEISRPGLRVAEACKQMSLDDDDIVGKINNLIAAVPGDFITHIHVFFLLV